MFTIERPLLKSSDDINKIREAAAVLRGLFIHLESMDFENVSSESLDFYIEKWILRSKARPSFMTLAGYRHSSCISINSVAVHGVPEKRQFIQMEDVVKIDVGVVKNGYFADSCRTFYRGDNPEKKALVIAGKECLYAGIDAVCPGAASGKIGKAITEKAESSGYYVHPEFTGHGVGFAFHEPPVILHNGEDNSGVVFEQNMVIALEPVVALRQSSMAVSDDGWGIYSEEGVLSVQFEHTVVVTDNGAEILT